MTILAYANEGASAGQGVGWTRPDNNSNTRLAFETGVRARSGLPSTWHQAGNRKFYLTLNTAFPPSSGTYGYLDSCQNDGVLPVVSVKCPTGVTWAQLGAAVPGQAIYNTAVAWAQDVAAWQDANRGTGKHGCTFLFFFHHEPDDETTTSAISGATTYAAGAANWRAACEKLAAILEANGCSVWRGTLSGQTTQEGIMYGMINMTAGPFGAMAPSAGGYQGTGTAFGYSGTTAANDGYFPDNWDWGNDNVVCPSGDAYNRPNVWGTAEWAWNVWYGAWFNRRKSFMEARHPWLRVILETGTDLPSAYSTLGNGRGWPAGLAFTVANWFRNMANYVNAQRATNPWFYISMWDSVATFDYRLDRTAADWACWVDEIIPHAAWLDVPPVPPPTITSFLPATGPEATPIIVTGTNLLGTTVVRVNGQPMAFTVNGDTQVTAIVPVLATSGLLQVVTPTGTATSVTGFTVTTGPIPPQFHPGVVSIHTRTRMAS